MKKVLIIATVPSMIGQFNMNNISILLDLGYEVHVACDWSDRSVWTDEKIKKLKKTLDEYLVKYYQIDFSRYPLNISNHIKAYNQVMSILKENNYTFVHCHTPIASAVTRIACKKLDTKAIYTAHGFHFYKGAPIKNWIIYYPIEKILSKYTDVLITINKEDYSLAKKKFKMKRLEYVAGVGVNTSIEFLPKEELKLKKSEFGIRENEFVLISVGELSKRKNHEIIIKSLSKIHNFPFKYIIVGKGELNNYLIDLSQKNNIKDNIVFTGFRSDVIELMQISDLFVFPSLQEGLPVALMEAMTIGLPVLCSNIRGNNDLIEEGVGGYLFESKKSEQIIKYMTNLDRAKLKTMGDYNAKKIKLFSNENINKKMINIYKNEKEN